MSIQKDRRVVKPSKMSERYARWFETRVPSTSPMFRYIVMLALAVPWSLIGYLLLSISSMNWVLVFLVNCAAGASIYSLYLSILESRFRSRTIDEQFSLIVERAHERVGSYGLVHVWQRESPEPYVASTFNSLFNAVIVSDTMVGLMLKIPDSGEALLAFHLLSRPSHRSVMDIVVALLVFSIFSTYIAQLPLSVPSYYPPSLILVILIINIGFWFFAPVILILILRGAFWAHNSAFERAAEIYMIHPQVARDEVLSSTKLDEEAAKAVVWVVKEWEHRKRNSRRLSMTSMILCMTYLASNYILVQSGWLFYAFWTGVFYVVLVASLIPGLIAYLFLRRWDRKRMGEIYYGTTDAHEPIWVD